jgi:septal ring factor EnvC (AmiA/AmiB activator)
MRRPRLPVPRSNARACVIAALAACISFPTFAADAPDAAKLKALEKQLEEGKAERDKLQSQAQSLDQSLAKLRAQMVTTAKDIQDQEYSVTVLENRLADMERDAQSMSEALKRRDTQMAHVLLALERLALRPGDALTLSPLAPDDAVRSAILLRSAVPTIKASAISLQSDLSAFYRARAQITDQKEKVAAGAATLLQKRANLEKLLRDRTEQQVALAVRSVETDRRLAKIAQDAHDLRELFAKLAVEKTKREEEERKRAAAAPPPVTPASKPTPPGVASAGKKPAPTPTNQGAKEHEVAVTRSFAQARGTMPYPVAGSLAGKYGEAAGTAEDAGLRAKGITINARPGAQVVAPYDGIAAFAGPFRGYGQLLIIEHSEGYHSLLAGMGRIDIAVGQRVLAGEPVGIMNESATSSLYVELRRDGQPINPIPWLADRGSERRLSAK